MPRFIVTISVDAHAHYAAAVDAETSDLAKQFAQDHEDELTWHNVGMTEYDDRDWDNIDPVEVGNDFAINPFVLDAPHPLHPASRCAAGPDARKDQLNSPDFWLSQLVSFLEA